MRTLFSIHNSPFANLFKQFHRFRLKIVLQFGGSVLWAWVYVDVKQSLPSLAFSWAFPSGAHLFLINWTVSVQWKKYCTIMSGLWLQNEQVNILQFFYRICSRGEGPMSSNWAPYLCPIAKFSRTNNYYIRMCMFPVTNSLLLTIWNNSTSFISMSPC